MLMKNKKGRCILCKKKYIYLQANGVKKYCPECIKKYPKLAHGGREVSRMFARIRDKFTCQDCGDVRLPKYVKTHNNRCKGLKGRIKLFDIHHLNGLCGKKSLGYDKMSEIDGLITLCHKCHYNRPEHTTKRKALFLHR